MRPIIIRAVTMVVIRVISSMPVVIIVAVRIIYPNIVVDPDIHVSGVAIHISIRLRAWASVPIRISRLRARTCVSIRTGGLRARTTTRRLSRTGPLRPIILTRFRTALGPACAPVNRAPVG